VLFPRSEFSGTMLRSPDSVVASSPARWSTSSSDDSHRCSTAISTACVFIFGPDSTPICGIHPVGPVGCPAPDQSGTQSVYCSWKRRLCDSAEAVGDELLQPSLGLGLGSFCGSEEPGGEGDASFGRRDGDSGTTAPGSRRRQGTCGSRGSTPQRVQAAPEALCHIRPIHPFSLEREDATVGGMKTAPASVCPLGILVSRGSTPRATLNEAETCSRAHSPVVPGRPSALATSMCREAERRWPMDAATSPSSRKVSVESSESPDGGKKSPRSIIPRPHSPQSPGEPVEAGTQSEGRGHNKGHPIASEDEAEIEVPRAIGSPHTPFSVESPRGLVVPDTDVLTVKNNCLHFKYPLARVLKCGDCQKIFTGNGARPCMTRHWQNQHACTGLTETHSCRFCQDFKAKTSCPPREAGVHAKKPITRSPWLRKRSFSPTNARSVVGPSPPDCPSASTVDVAVRRRKNR